MLPISANEPSTNSAPIIAIEKPGIRQKRLKKVLSGKGQKFLAKSIARNSFWLILKKVSLFGLTVKVGCKPYRKENIVM